MISYLPFGDSKTANGVYSQYLTPDLTVGTDIGVVRPAIIALGATTTTYWAGQIDTSLAAYPAQDAPRVILVNLGVNDWGVPNSNATMIANLEYIIDAFHAKYPDALILVTVPWERGYDTRSDEFRSIIRPALKVGRPYVLDGLDEGIYLKGDDDGETWTSDGKHPTTAGYELTAELWASRILEVL